MEALEDGDSEVKAHEQLDEDLEGGVRAAWKSFSEASCTVPGPQMSFQAVFRGFEPSVYNLWGSGQTPTSWNMGPSDDLGWFCLVLCFAFRGLSYSSFLVSTVFLSEPGSKLLFKRGVCRDYALL